MKLTRHNGRSGKHGTYNPRHNDRRFDVENSEHIDAQRAKKNVYWDCYRGFTTPELRENPEQPDFSFEEIERMYYYEHYSDHVDAQNARNEKTRHTERNRTVEDLFSNPRMFAGYGRQRGWEREISGNELPDNEDGFVKLSEEEVRQLELPKEWIA